MYTTCFDIISIFITRIEKPIWNNVHVLSTYTEILSLTTLRLDYEDFDKPYRDA